MNYARFFIWIDFFILFYCYETWSPLVSNCHESHRTVAALLCEQASKKSVFRWSISVYLYNYKASLVDTHSSSQCFPYSSFPACCGGLLVTPELALSCWSSAASFSPLKHLQKSVPQPCVMNKEALPLFPWVLFPCCYTECVLLTKPVMDVGLPLSLCLPDKEGISLHCNRGHTHTGKHANTHSCTPQTYTHRHPEDPAYNDLQIFVLTPTPQTHQHQYGTDRTFMFIVNSLVLVHFNRY